jgi:hypothetical protein
MYCGQGICNTPAFVNFNLGWFSFQRGKAPAHTPLITPYNLASPLIYPEFVEIGTSSSSSGAYCLP